MFDVSPDMERAHTASLRKIAAPSSVDEPLAKSAKMLSRRRFHRWTQHSANSFEDKHSARQRARLHCVEKLTGVSVSAEDVKALENEMINARSFKDATEKCCGCNLTTRSKVLVCASEAAIDDTDKSGPSKVALLGSRGDGSTRRRARIFHFFDNGARRRR